MSQVAVVVKLKVLDGQRDAMTEAVKPGIETAKGEEGTRFYVFHHDAVEPNTVWFYELYADQDAANAHMGSEAFKSGLKRLHLSPLAHPSFHF